MSTPALRIVLVFFLPFIACGGMTSDGNPLTPPASQSDGRAVEEDMNMVPKDMALPLTCVGVPGFHKPGSCTTLADGLERYTPKNPSYKDGGSAGRWIHLPPDTQIDTSNADNWVFPLGTCAYKQITLDGLEIEIREMCKERPGKGSKSWKFTSYAWLGSNGKGFQAVPNGVKKARGTHLDIPSQTECVTCHDHSADGVSDMLIGFSAFQLNHTGSGITLESLIAKGRISNPTNLSLGCRVRSANTAIVNGLEYLNANCGFCHRGSKAPPSGRSLQLNLSCGDVKGPTTGLQPEEQPTYITAVGVTSGWGINYKRVDPRKPTRSAVLARARRTPADGGQMPPIGRNTVDPLTTTIETWINSL
jgi:hypothetical protein